MKDIGNCFLELARKTGDQLDAMRLSKLVYIAQGWSLAIRDRPLVKDAILAVSYGPIIPSLEGLLARFGNEIIADPLLDESGPAEAPSNDFRQLLDRVWEVYGGYTSFQLANLTVDQDSPWQVTRNMNPFEDRPSIPKRLLQSYYRKLALN